MNGQQDNGWETIEAGAIITPDGWETPVPETRAREIRRTAEQLLMELPEDIHPDDVLDALWGVMGELSPEEEAVARERIARII